MALLYADPCGKFYANATQMTQGLFSVCTCNVLTSNLPAGAVEKTAINPTGFPSSTILIPATAGPTSVGMRLNFNNFGNGTDLCFLNDGSGNTQMAFNLTPSGFVNVLRANSTLLGTTSTPISLNTWNYFEFQTFCSTAAGTAVVRLNNTVVLSLSGVNTQGQATTNMAQMMIAAGGTGGIQFLQDLYITDSTTPAGNTVTGFLGDVSMAVLSANRNGNFANYSPNGAATLWQCVQDGTPDDATTFVSDSTVNDRVSFGYGSLATSSPILGVVHVSRISKSDSGTRTGAQTLTSNGVDIIAPTVSPGTTYSYVIQPSTIDPSTGVAWTVNGVNAIQGGLKTVS